MVDDASTGAKDLVRQLHGEDDVSLLVAMTS